jgi:hypothetical protein
MTPEERRKKEEREAFWAEYKRRLALRDRRKREMEVLLGFHSSILAGTALRGMPVADYGGIDTATRRDYRTSKSRSHKSNIPTIRRQAPTTKG